MQVTPGYWTDRAEADAFAAEHDGTVIEATIAGQRLGYLVTLKDRRTVDRNGVVVRSSPQLG